MSFPERIISLLTPRNLVGDPELKNRIFLFNLTAYFSLLFFAFLGIRYLFIQHYLNTIFFFCSFALIFVALFLFPPSKNYTFVSTILSIILGLLFIYILYFEKTISSEWFLFLIYPVVIIPILEIKKGMLFSLILPAILIPGMIFPEFFSATSYDKNFFIPIIPGYLFLIIIMYFNDNIRKKSRQEDRKRINQSLKESKEKNEFISGLSHQLRTSLSNIILANDLVESSNLDTKQKELINTLQASTNNLAASINKIVDVSRPDVTQLKDNKISFEIRAVIENIARLFRKENHLELEISIKDSIPDFLTGDPVKLKQILLNLIQGTLLNEDDYSQAMRISIDQEYESQEDIRLKIILISSLLQQNNQPISGIESKSHSKKKQYDLELTKRIVESAGGQLILDEEDQSDSIIINLLYNKDLSRKTEKNPETFFKPEQKPVKLNEARILLVEDNRINQKIVILSIQNLVRSIDVAANGKEALDMFGKSKYDIILMDIQMPVMNGILATKKIREIESITHTNTPIIAITANALAGDRENCLAVGMDEYISKPFSIDDLIGKMKYLLQDSY